MRAATRLREMLNSPGIGAWLDLERKYLFSEL
jgi:hypothetical protein